MRGRVQKIFQLKKVSAGRKKISGKVSAIINLNDITSEKETYHIEIETEEALSYQPVQLWE